MKEIDYVKATNLAKIQIVGTILRDILPGDEYGIPQENYSRIVSWITDLREHLHSVIDVEEDKSLKAELWIGKKYWQTVPWERDRDTIEVGVIEPLSGYSIGEEESLCSYEFVFVFHDMIDENTAKFYYSIPKVG